MTLSVKLLLSFKIYATENVLPSFMSSDYGPNRGKKHKLQIMESSRRECQQQKSFREKNKPHIILKAFIIIIQRSFAC
jgi:hypothetical protein